MKKIEKIKERLKEELPIKMIWQECKESYRNRTHLKINKIFKEHGVE